jgi:hypothetical protein
VNGNDLANHQAAAGRCGREIENLMQLTRSSRGIPRLATDARFSTAAE